MGYWSGFLTEKSWRVLQELRKKYRFVLIGGWAVYLWTRQQKSKDVDIVVDINELQKLKNENLIKNDRLKKYEIKFEEIDVDIYVSHFSRLVVPIEDVWKHTREVEGFIVVVPELLLILKQGAEIGRGDSVKGEKDRIDLLSLLFFADIDFKKYYELLKRYGVEDYVLRLKGIVSSFMDYRVFGFAPKELKIKKKEIIDKLKKL